MQQSNSGSKAYLFSIVMVAVLGGLLFGYDTAVISGADKGLQAFFLGAKDFTYSDGWHGFTCASRLYHRQCPFGLFGFQLGPQEVSLLRRYDVLHIGFGIYGPRISFL